MKTVQLILDKGIVGHVELYAELLDNPRDCRCDPPGMVSFANAQQIAHRIREGGTWGYIERYRWQLEAAPA